MLCYSFLAKDDQASMLMVDVCRHAYSNKSGWAEDGSYPPEEVR